MSQLLHLDSSILGPQSVSRELSASVVERLVEADPATIVTYRDLAATPLSHLTGAHLAGASSHAPANAALQAELDVGATVMREFLAADTVVVGVAFYNFGIPSQLKAWVDRVVVAGKTFRYGEAGPVGLATGKRVVLAIARGGFYGPGTPTASYEHAETYLRCVFGFIGVSRIEVVSAEGIAVGPEVREAGISHARTRIAELSV